MHLIVNILFVILSYQCLTLCAFQFGMNKYLYGKTIPKPYSLMRTRRFTSSFPPSISEISYEQFMKFVKHKSALIIDVRSGIELASTGVFPNSYHIPISRINYAFNLTPDEFLQEFKFTKPDKNENIIFACAHGIRSLVACYFLDVKGYNKLYNYKEGWLGWTTHRQNQTTT